MTRLGNYALHIRFSSVAQGLLLRQRAKKMEPCTLLHPARILEMTEATMLEAAAAAVMVVAWPVWALSRSVVH
jgi:hypothetical protein